MSGEFDLRGVPCPLNWAKAKVKLESLEPGEKLELWIDDPRSVRDLPRAAETEGYEVIEVGEIRGGWRIVIER